jgi:5'-3' exonuclease
MGIPVYFKTLVQEYQDSILIKNKLTSVKSLFLDLNCAIHPCCSGESDEEIMLNKIISKIDELVQYTNVEDLLYIAVDGIPPKGKMKQQRMRRYKSIYENKVWDTNAISPGTRFMDKLNKRLKTIQSDKFKIIISDTTERGEGEHKILQYIKTHELTNSVIYGLDADLIMLSIVSQKDNIYLLRERTEYNIEDTDNDYIYMNIDKLKDFIVKDIGVKANKEIVLNDYIFMCFLLGNDFINHIHSLSLRYSGYDYLMETYKKLQERYSGYFRLIDLRLDNCIHLTFFKEFIRELAFKEDTFLEKRKVIRDKQYKIAYSKYGEIFNEFMKFLSDKDFTMETIHNFEMSKLYDSNEYEITKEMINNLPILSWQKEKRLKHIPDENICDDYLASLIWTSHYYFKECVNWRWSTFYDNTPSLKELSLYLEKTNSLSFNKENKEYTIEELLKFIFPNESHKLHNYKLLSKNYELRVEPFYHRYFWECPIKFI